MRDVLARLGFGAPYYCHLAPPICYIGLEVYFHFITPPDGSHLELAAARGVSDEQPEALHRLEFGQAVCGAVAKSREKMVAHRHPVIDRSLNERMDEAVLSAVKKWRYKPAALNGKPVAVHLVVRVNFDLDQ